MFLYSTVSTLKPAQISLGPQYAAALRRSYRSLELWCCAKISLDSACRHRYTYTISPSFSLYRMVVFPAASRPTIKILISFFPHNRSNSFEKVRPIFAVFVGVCWMRKCMKGGLVDPVSTNVQRLSFAFAVGGRVDRLDETELDGCHL